MAALNVKIKDLCLKNPVMTASGTFGYGLEFADFVPLEEIGGIIVKGTTLNPRQGNDYPRMAETPQGMLNCVGLQNKGVDYFAKHIYPQIKDIEFNKDSKRIILSHSRTFEDAQREEKRAAKKPRAKKEDVVKIDNQPAATTLGDIDVLAQLKAQMEKGE